MRPTYFLGPSPLAECRTVQTWDGIQLSPSLAHFCPFCGNIWARLLVPGQLWHTVTASCSACPPYDGAGKPSGSLFLSWNLRQLDEFPPELIRREFLLHLAHFEKA